jgi:NAD dependent epimerase/dehydratase family enzyme
LPIEKSKASYLSLRDVGNSIWALISKPSSFHIYSLTGPESITGQEIASRISQVVEAKVDYKPIDYKFARRYLRSELGDQAIALVDYYIVMMSLLKAGKLDFTTDEVKKITKKDPLKIDALFKDYSQLFRP